MSSGNASLGATGGISYADGLPASGLITDGTPGPPLNVLSRNVGDGSMEIVWTDPASGMWDYVDVYLSTTANGTYRKINCSGVTGNHYVIKNLVFGQRIYCMLKAVLGDVESDWSLRARDATCSAGRGRVLFTGQVGDTIPLNAVFAATVGEQLVGLKVVQAGTLA